MAAKTLATIKTIVRLHHGRGSLKDTLESYLAGEALKFALMRHNFKDAQAVQSDLTITEDATTVSMSSITGMVNIVSARIVEASGSRNRILPLKTRLWWDEKIINPEDNQKGWPMYGLRVGTTMHLDRPAESGLELRIRCTTEQTFSNNNSVCPIYLLDNFVTYYVTALVFKSLEEHESYMHWMTQAVGSRYLIDGTVGGELANAIAADTMQDDATELRSEPPDMLDPGDGGVSVLNNILGHSDNGNTRWWF